MPVELSPRGARLAMVVLTVLLALVCPLPGGFRLPLLALLALGGWGAATGRAFPWWAVYGGVALFAALPLAGAWSVFRSSSWCAVMLLWAGALLLQRARPGRLLTVFFLNMAVLAFSAMDPGRGLPLVVIALAVLVWLLALQYAYRPPGVPLSWRLALTDTFRLLVPVGLVVFLFSALLPGREDIETVSGFSGAGILEAGAFGRIRLSNKPAFRVQFDSYRPPGSLYWRGDVLEDNAGFTWRRLRQMTLPHSATPQPSIEVLDPLLSRAPFLEEEQPAPATLPAGQREALLATPRTVRADPRVQAFLADIDRSTARAVLDGIRAKLASGEFVYTLRPGRIGRLEIGRLLAETKAGFCEHYAAASANLLRVAGIPSRIVAGFRGGSWNPWTKTLTVRALHAHAWVEAWDGERWLRFDPTDAVTTDFLERDAAEWDQRRWSWADWLGKRWEALWLEAPLAAASVVGLGITLALAALVAGALRLRAAAAGRDPASRLLARLEGSVRRRALRRTSGETPLAWMARVAATQPARARAWQQAAVRYERLAYMPRPH